MNSTTKKQYATVTAPDGTQITRQTGRTYTHAILIQYQGQTTWRAVHFCGSESLMKKQAEKYTAPFIAPVTMSEKKPKKLAS